MKFKHLCLPYLLVSTLPVLANQSTEPTKIVYLQNWGSGGSNGLFVQTEESQKVNPANCGYTGDYFMSDTTSDISRAMLLSAHMSGKKVELTIYSGGCSSNGRPSIVAVKLQE